MFSLLWGEDWPIYRGNIFFTGNNDEIRIKNDKLFWLFEADGRIMHTAVSQGRIYFTTASGYLYAVKLYDGETLFRIKTRHPVLREPVISSGIILTAGRLWITAYNKENGNVLWARKDYDNGIYAHPTVYKDTVIYGSRRRLFARHLFSGRHKWEQPPELPIWGGFPYFYGNFIFIQTRDLTAGKSYIVKVDFKTGKVAWKKQIPYALKITAPVAYEKKLYTVSGSNLICIDTADGKEIFTHRYSDYIVNHPAFTDQSIFLSLRSGKMIQADLRDGSVKHVLETEYQSGVRKMLIRDVLYYGGTQKRLYQGKYAYVSKITGLNLSAYKQEFEFECLKEGTLGPLASSDGLLMAPAGNILYAVGRDGVKIFGSNVLRRYRSPDPPDSSDEKKDDIERDICIVVRDDEGHPVSGASVTVVTTFKNGRREKNVYRSSKEGKAVINVFDKKDEEEGFGSQETEIIVEKDGYMARKKKLSIKPSRDDKPQEQNVSLEKLVKGRSYSFENITFDTGRASLTVTSKSVLNAISRVLKKNPSLVLEVQGHTDHVGDEEDNMTLSLKRAHTVKAYLIKQGVFQERLVPKGFGETRPVAPNHTVDGRRANRRTEFKILED